MSAQQDDNKDPSGSQGQTDATVAAGEQVTETTPEPAASATPVVAAPRGGSSAVAWLALLLVLALAAGAAWFYLQLQQREGQLVQRLSSVETVATRRESGLDERFEQQSRQLQAQLQQALESLRSASSAQAQSTQSLAEQLARVQAVLAKQGEELARYNANDRQSWLLAELEYLLRMANQRLIMASDTAAAEALLNSADNILRELDDISLHPVRAAVAADLAAVRAVPTVDVEGIYVRLSALQDQAAKLRIFRLPERAQTPLREAQGDWQARLEQGYRAALDKLSSYIIIRRRDVPMQTLMDPQWEGLVRQNLRMLLEQAQVALLSGNARLYRASLERADHWVAEFFDSDTAAAQAMASELRQLERQTVAVPMPDISASLKALAIARREHRQQGGGE